MVKAIGASRPICKTCKDAILAAGASVIEHAKDE